MNKLTPHNLTGRRVLIVDDEPENLRVLAKTLESEKLNIFMAGGGKEALEQAAEVRPDLILLDVVMPGIDGFAVCEQLKSDERYQSIPVIFLSGRGDRADIDKGFALGCADYIIKPFKIDEVCSRVRTHLLLSQSKFGEKITIEEDWTDIQDMRVLVVDDVPENIDILIKTLSADHLKFSVGLNGRDATEIALKAKPDLIVLDVMMPEVSGFEACRELKANEQTQHIPVIFLTALQQPGDIERGFSLGCVDYIPKPFRDSEVRARIRSQLKLQKLSRQKQIWMDELARAKSELEKQVLERNLRLARAEQTSSDYQKSQLELITRVSHDIRTPLNAILGFSELLYRSPQDLKPHQRDSVGEISKAGRYLLALVNDTLEMGQIESGILEIKVDDVDITQLVQNRVLPILGPMAQEYDITLRNNLEQLTNVCFKADPIRLARIIQNLGANAIKYNRPGGEVVLDFHITEEGSGCLQVKDTGYGIPEDQWGSIFEPYVRLKPVGRDKEGTGIGLTIVRQLVESMNGKISLKSEIDQGSTFTVTLPLAP